MIKECHFLRILIINILEICTCTIVFAFDIIVVCKRYNRIVFYFLYDHFCVIIVTKTSSFL